MKSQEGEHLGVVYEDVYVGLNRDAKPSISFATSGDNNTSDAKRFKQDEKILTRLLGDLKKLKA